MFRVRLFSRPFRLVGALAAVVAVLGLSSVIPPSSTVPVVRAADSGTAVTQNHPVMMPTLTGGGGTAPTQTYPNASVTVSQTTNLQQRQVIKVSWTGFERSRNYPLTPVDSRNSIGDYTEFPVVLVECWGADTPDKPMDPTHCQQIRTAPIYPSIQGPKYAYAVANDPAHLNPTDAINGPGRATALNFNSIDGTHYDGNVPDSVGLNGNAVTPDNAVITYSDLSGSRSNVEFEVRGGQDIPALGCSDKSVCTLEVIPILQPYCNPGTDSLSKILSKFCAAGSKLASPSPGNKLPDFRTGSPNAMLMGGMWWFGTEWKNRFAFDLNMAPLPGTCPVVDQRPTVSVDGSEAPTPLMASWEQPFCFDSKNPFKLSHSFGVNEDAARQNLVTQGPAGYNSNGIFTSFPVTGSPRPLVHAPVAMTGWTIAYKIDDHNQNEYTNLTLSPLLLAKLITSSYGGAIGDPAVAGNPTSMYQDPEFKALNPGFTPYGVIGDGGSVIWDQFSSDAFRAMFAYIDADPEARAWLDGKPDAYSGMVVNFNFRGKLKSPQTLVQYLDGWVNPDSCPDPKDLTYCSAPKPCRTVDPKPFWGFEVTLTQISLDATAKAALNRSPGGMGCDVQTDNTHPRWVKGKGILPIGQRDLLAFTTVPLAERYGLSLAKLQSHTANSKAVGPSGWENPTNDGTRFDTLGPALGYMKQDQATGVASPDFGVFPYNNPYAYPGVLPVYAAIPTCGLDSVLAGRYADFLEFAAGAGQTPGMGGGQLPWGYSPLPKAYADYTRTAAAAVRAQKCEVPAPPDLSPRVRDDAGLAAPGADGSGWGPPAGQGVPGAGNTNLAAAAPGAGKSAPSSLAGRPGPAAAMTGSVDSWLDAWGLLILLLAGLVAALAVPVIHIAGQPGHPVRRFFTGIDLQQLPLVGRKPDATSDAPGPNSNHDGQEKT